MFYKLMKVKMIGMTQAVCSFVFRTVILALRRIVPIRSSGSLRRTCAEPAVDFLTRKESFLSRLLAISNRFLDDTAEVARVWGSMKSRQVPGTPKATAVPIR